MSLPVPRLYKFTLLMREGRDAPKFQNLGLRLTADEGDLDSCIETLIEDHLYLKSIPNVEYHILHEEVGMGFSGYCHDVFIEGIKAMS